MDIRIYNSLSDRVETFEPLRKGEVSIYVCGPTVYSDPHIGNLRPVVAFDVLRRLFIHLGYKVTYVSNFTDVDDKIINRALREQRSESDVSEQYIRAYREVVKSINSLAPTFAPRVTEYMPQIIKYIEELVDAGAAYVADGDVYFRVSSISHYGELSNINIADLLSGTRVEENVKKESPLDFVLWKKTEIGIRWESRWSSGRPGWHTECCVMINSLFPDGRIDIHGGGFDLKFPHHENEIAQSRAHNGNAIATYWMHNGFVNLGDEKMSKSLGNVVLAKDAIDRYGGNVVRLALSGTYYRSPLSVTSEVIEASTKELEHIAVAFAQIAVILQLANRSLSIKKKPDIDSFVAYLADDLNTPNALTELFAIIKKANGALRLRPLDLDSLENLFHSLRGMFEILGLKIDYPLLTDDDRSTYADYVKYKSEKNFTESDRLRRILIEKHII